ncbi:MAG: hypothetical protein QMB78_03815, partial [Rhodospirillales bacterium]
HNVNYQAGQTPNNSVSIKKITVILSIGFGAAIIFGVIMEGGRVYFLDRIDRSSSQNSAAVSSVFKHN